MSSTQLISGGRCPSMRTTTGRFRGEQLWDAADLSCRHLPELVSLRGMDPIYGSGSQATGSRSPSTGRNGVRHHSQPARRAIGGTGAGGALCGPSVDQKVSDVSVHLRRELSKMLRISLLSQIRALTQFWGSRAPLATRVGRLLRG
jgi:hypothetical protein